MATIIQITNNREKRTLNYKNGTLYRWRKFYPSYADTFYQSQSQDKTDDKTSAYDSEVSDNSTFVPDFYQKGGLIMIKDASDIGSINSEPLSTLIIDGFYSNVRKHKISDLNLDDIADASRNMNIC